MGTGEIGKLLQAASEQGLKFVLVMMDLQWSKGDWEMNGGKWNGRTLLSF